MNATVKVETFAGIDVFKSHVDVGIYGESRVVGGTSMMAAEKNRLKSTRDATVREQIESHIRWLEAEIAALTDKISHLVAADPQWQVTGAILRSVPGVGRIVASAPLTELTELGRLNRYQVAALAGVVPLCRDSGQ